MKKRFFNAVVATVAAMSLSVSAFAEAATPGLSDLPGWSGVPGASESAVTVTIGDKSIVEVGSVDGILVKGSKAAFAGAASVTLAASIVSGEDIPADMVETVEDAVYNVLNNWKPRLVTKKFDVNTVVRVSLYDENQEEFQPKAALDLTIASDKNSNVVAYVDDEGKVEWYEIDRESNNKLMTITTKHFSDYYFLTLDDTVVDTLLGVVGPEDPDDGDNNGGNNGGNGGDTGNTESTSETAAPEATTTTEPSNTTDNNTNNGSNGGDNTTAPVDDTTDAPSETDSNGSGNTGSTDGTGSDKNQATGVVLAVIPAAIAAAAVVISKKRK